MEFNTNKKRPELTFGALLCILLCLTRRERDSNPRYPFEVYTLSRRAPSTTRTPLHYGVAKVVFFLISKAN